jgi:hypothetical protein
MVKLTHTFIERCELIDSVTAIYIALASLWIAFLIVFVIHSCIINKENALYLQKSITVIPLMKGIESLINGIYLNSCPWVT